MSTGSVKSSGALMRSRWCFQPVFVADFLGQRRVAVNTRRQRRQTIQQRSVPWLARNAVTLAASPVSSTVPSASITRSAPTACGSCLRGAAAHARRIVGRHAAILRAVAIEAGSGPIFAQRGRVLLACSGQSPPGLQANARRRPALPGRSSWRPASPAESVTAWPERLVPAARKVTTRGAWWASASRAAISFRRSPRRRSWAPGR